jgi:hypothetical protein
MIGALMYGVLMISFWLISQYFFPFVGKPQISILYPILLPLIPAGTFSLNEYRITLRMRENSELA